MWLPCPARGAPCIANSLNPTYTRHTFEVFQYGVGGAAPPEALDRGSFRGGVVMPDVGMFKSHQCGRQFTGLELPDIVHLRLKGRCTLEECQMINQAHLEYAKDVSYFF